MPEKMESAARAVGNIKIGWNIGNVFDCCGLGNVSDTGLEVSDYEKQWGNPAVNRELIHLVKEVGYKAVRVPVTYYEHMDAKGNLDIAWVERVKEVVDWVLEEGMYCITNVHHDTGAGDQAWLRADKKIFELVKSKYIRIWEQLALTFRDYGERLILEGFNEMLDVNSSWDYTTQEGYASINAYNQVFVNVIRKSGGNNMKRNLLLNTYGASPLEPASEAFQIPKDKSEGHLMVGVHFYKPDAFTAGDMEYWNDEGEKEVQEFFKRMDRHYLSKNIPVIMGECGTHDIRSEEERARYIKSVLSEVKTRCMAYFWWDDGGCMRLIDREKNELIYCKLQKAMMETILKE